MVPPAFPAQGPLFFARLAISRSALANFDLSFTLPPRPATPSPSSHHRDAEYIIYISRRPAPRPSASSFFAHFDTVCFMILGFHPCSRAAMTMTESSPPPSPTSEKHTALDDADPFTTSSASDDEMPLQSHPTLPRSAINKSLYHTFPTPPQSPYSPYFQPTSPRVASPHTPTFPRRQKPRVAASPQAPFPRTRRRSSLSTQILEMDYGPPPHPAPTTPLPAVPRAPRVRFTTPGDERARYSSYQLYDKLKQLEKNEMWQETRNKRHSAPPLRNHQSLPLPTPRPPEYEIVRRTFSENAATMEGDGIPPLTSGRRRPSIVPLYGRRRSSFKENMI